MQEFELRKAGGEKIKTLEYAEIVKTDGKKQFRYMKAIPTEKICLQCHGSEIEPEEKAALNKWNHLLTLSNQKSGFCWNRT